MAMRLLRRTVLHRRSLPKRAGRELKHGRGIATVGSAQFMAILRLSSRLKLTSRRYSRAAFKSSIGYTRHIDRHPASCRHGQNGV